jgi:hypothetical protein
MDLKWLEKKQVLTKMYFNYKETKRLELKAQKKL